MKTALYFITDHKGALETLTTGYLVSESLFRRNGVKEVINEPQVVVTVFTLKLKNYLLGHRSRQSLGNGNNQPHKAHLTTVFKQANLPGTGSFPRR